MKKAPLKVLIRLAQETDTPAVMELSSHIWEGEDYVPYVWAEWLSDRRGRLAVAEHEGRVVGLGKLTRLSKEDWWLEGLRVHPEFEGRGIASQLHAYLMQTWSEMGSGSVRLGSASFRLPVHHLCDRFGFRKVLECTPFVALVLSDQPGASNYEAGRETKTDQIATRFSDPFIASGDLPVRAGFELVKPAEAAEVTAFARQTPVLRFTHGLMDLGWQWAPPRRVYLASILRDQKAWWWRGRRGLLALRQEEDPKKEPTPMIQLLACSLDDVLECLLDYRRLAAALGYARAGWMAPLHPELLPLLEKAGFQRDWEFALYIYTNP